MKHAIHNLNLRAKQIIYIHHEDTKFKQFSTTCNFKVRMLCIHKKKVLIVKLVEIVSYNFFSVFNFFLCNHPDWTTFQPFNESFHRSLFLFQPENAASFIYELAQLREFITYK